MFDTASIHDPAGKGKRRLAFLCEKSGKFRNRLLIAALLFAHGALAIAACDWLARAPAEAVAGPAPDCHEAVASNANLCLAHCLGEDQSTMAPQVPLAALAQAVFVVPEVPAMMPATFARSALRATGPPPRIRFQTLRL